RRLDADTRPRAIVRIVAVGHDGVEAVIAAGQFDHDQDTILLCAQRCGLSPGWRAGECADGAEREAAESHTQEIATRYATDARKHGCHMSLPYSLSVCRVGKAKRAHLCGRWARRKSAFAHPTRVRQHSWYSGELMIR